MGKKGQLSLEALIDLPFRYQTPVFFMVTGSGSGFGVEVTAVYSQSPCFFGKQVKLLRTNNTENILK